MAAMMKIIMRSLREAAYSLFHRNILDISTHLPHSSAISQQSRFPRRKRLPFFLSRQNFSSLAIQATLFFDQNTFALHEISPTSLPTTFTHISIPLRFLGFKQHAFKQESTEAPQGR